MFTVALIGPDGAGKTTLARRLESTLPMQAKYVYMGINPDASNHMLPTTRLWYRLRRSAARETSAPPAVQGKHSGSLLKRSLRVVKSAAGLVNRVADEWYRQLLVWYYARRRHIVLQDRHYWFDFYSYDIVQQERTIFQRVHGLLLERVFPKPDMTILLDAPGAVLYARKGEGTPESLEQRRQQYHEAGQKVEHFFVVDATQPEDQVLEQLQKLIVEFAGRQRDNSCSTGKPSRVGASPCSNDVGKTALITDAGTGTAITIMRSLRRQGWRIIAADADPRSLGFRIHGIDHRVIYPRPAEKADAFVRTIEQAVRDFGVDLVWPVTDETILPLATLDHAVQDRAKLVVPEQRNLSTAGCKWKTLRLAEQLGIPVPKTLLIHSVGEAREAARSLNWPVVLKPQASCHLNETSGVDRFEVRYANDVEQLIDQMRQWEGRCTVLLQEYTAGCGVGLEFLMSEGRPLAAFQHRRLREVPVTGGASSYRESVPLDSTLFRYAVQLLQGMNWTGLAMVEFKGDGDRYRLMEVNGRPWGSLPLAVRAGIDFPSLAVQLAIRGENSFPAQPLTTYRCGVRSRNVRLDLTWIAAVLGGARKYPFLPFPGRLQAVLALLGYLNPRNKCDLWCWQDPWPCLLEFPSAIAKIWRKCRQRAASESTSQSPIPRGAREVSPPVTVAAANMASGDAQYGSQ